MMHIVTGAAIALGFLALLFGGAILISIVIMRYAGDEDGWS